MTHGESLLRAILEDPASDAARLVYADWLEETGETARAEFIRVQIEAERLETAVAGWASRPGPAGGAEAGAALADAQSLRHRERELFHPVALLWYAPLGCGVDSWWDRGFVKRIALTTADFLNHAAALFAAQPITEVRLTGRCPLYTSRGGRWFWSWTGSAGSLYHAEFIPDPLYEHLPHSRQNRFAWPSLAAAHAALSRACVAYGRDRAGLPPLEPTTPALPLSAAIRR